MAVDPRVIQLLVRWEQLREQGRDVAPRELCADCPELAGELEQRVGALKGLAGAAETLDGTPLPPVPDGYRMVRWLGGGSYGEVWLAEDLDLDRFVALKTLTPYLGGARRERVLEALRHEAKTLATVRHPNVVQVHGWRRAGDVDYLVLQYVPGGSLADRLRGGSPLGWQEAARYVADVGEGLLEVHGRGILHCDIKPANILWDPERDEALLTDFGVAVRLAEAAAVAGTLPYMAPEALAGRASAATDVYSLAATLFHLTTGEKPFPGSTIAELRHQIALGLPDPDPRLAGVPGPLEEVIRSGVAADPARRPALGGFVTALRGTLNQLMADSLTMPPAQEPEQTPVDLRLVVSREVSPGVYQPVATTHAQAGRLTRDIKKVPRPPDQVRLRTGDRVRVEVSVDRAGYITVFNVGPTGMLNLLHPEDPSSSAPSRIESHRPLYISDIELMPPEGRERLFAVWTQSPIPLHSDRLQGLADHGEAAGSRPYRATRDLKRVRQSILQLSSEGQRAVTLELDHGLP